MKTRFRSDDTNENSYLPQKNNMNNEEYRKVIDHDNSNTLLSNDNVNKVYVEEIQFNELMDSNAKYNNSEQSSNILNYSVSSKQIVKSKKDPIMSEAIDNVNYNINIDKTNFFRFDFIQKIKSEFF